MQEKRKRSVAERKIQAEVQISEKAKVQERLLALEAYRRSQGNNAAAQEEVCSLTVQGISSQSVFFETPVRISNYDIFDNSELVAWSEGFTI